MKIYISLLVFYSVLFQAFGQRKLERVNYDKNDQRLPTETGCYYFSLVKPSLKNSSVDTLFTFYCATERLRSKEAIDRNGVRHGSYIRFNENGFKELSGAFHTGNPIVIEQWYPNGNLKSRERYEESDSFIDEYYSETGSPMVRRGNGWLKGSLSEFYKCAFEVQGKVVNGLPDSVW